MLVSVLVPTYLRHHDLARCLASPRVQRRAPDIVLVTLREEDEESRALADEFVSSWPALRTVPVTQRGVVAAMNAALAVAESDVLALTDKKNQIKRSRGGRILSRAPFNSINSHDPSPVLV